MAKKGTKKSVAAKKPARKAAKRTLVDTGSDKRFVRRSTAGRFKESDDVSQGPRDLRPCLAMRPISETGGDLPPFALSIAELREICERNSRQRRQMTVSGLDVPRRHAGGTGDGERFAQDVIHIRALAVELIDTRAG